MPKNPIMVNFFFLLIILFVNPQFSEQKTRIQDNKNHESVKIFDVKTFSSGPMGIGLVKSYHNGSNKVCIYSTVQGQQKVKFNNKLTVCPDKFPE